MEVVQKKLFIACDGTEFGNLQDCLKWEQSILMPQPVHLKDEQIVQLFSAAFVTSFKEWPEGYDTKVKLYVREKFEGGGFAFWFTYKAEGRVFNFTGEISQDTYNGLYFDQTLHLPDDSIERSSDWNEFDAFHFQAAYQYLDSIGFFTPQPKLKENAHLKRKSWKLIYTKRYTQMAVIHRCDNW